MAQGVGMDGTVEARALRGVERWERLASPPTRTLPEPFSLCDSERIRVPSLNRMDDLTSHSKGVTARCAAIGTELQ